MCFAHKKNIHVVHFLCHRCLQGPSFPFNSNFVHLPQWLFLAPSVTLNKSLDSEQSFLLWFSRLFFFNFFFFFNLGREAGYLYCLLLKIALIFLGGKKKSHSIRHQLRFFLFFFCRLLHVS